MTSTAHSIAFLIWPETRPMTLALAEEALRVAQRVHPEVSYELRFLQAEAPAAGAWQLPGEPWAGRLEGCHKLFVLADEPPAQVAPALAQALKQLARGGIPIGGLSAGVYPLAQLGLLDGYRAAVHWRWQDDFTERFPKVIATSHLFDWDREVRTCDPAYYKWTQWAFLKMFGSYYCYDKQQARPIEELTAAFEQGGTQGLNVACSQELHFTAEEWRAMPEEEKERTLHNYRLAFRADTMVNWCPKLGTVLANDEVHDGLSVRGGHPVEQKRMKQWLLRVTAYAQRMLDGLDRLAWSDSLKEIQRNWIGRSEGAQVFFDIKDSARKLEIFTTRPDTIFGVTFMVIAPEHEWVGELTTPDNKAAVEEYICQAKKRSERERIAETKRVSGVATGSYAINPFTGKAIPIYISDYVLAGYGTARVGAVLEAAWGGLATK